MAEHKLSTFDQLKKLALAGKRDSAKQVAELAEMVPPDWRISSISASLLLCRPQIGAAEHRLLHMLPS